MKQYFFMACMSAMTLSVTCLAGDSSPSVAGNGSPSRVTEKMPAWPDYIFDVNTVWKMECVRDEAAITEDAFAFAHSWCFMDGVALDGTLLTRQQYIDWVKPKLLRALMRKNFLPQLELYYQCYSVPSMYAPDEVISMMIKRTDAGTIQFRPIGVFLQDALRSIAWFMHQATGGPVRPCSEEKALAFVRQWLQANVANETLSEYSFVDKDNEKIKIVLGKDASGNFYIAPIQRVFVFKPDSV